MTTCRYVCTVCMHEKKPQKPPEAFRACKIKIFLGHAPNLSSHNLYYEPHFLYLPKAPSILSVALLVPSRRPRVSKPKKDCKSMDSVVNQLKPQTASSTRNGALLDECFLNLFVQRNREMANTESTKALYSQAQKQSCTLHSPGDLTHLPLSYPASITETISITHCAVLT